MLFLMAAGLTLVFGIMNLVNLAHGSLYMVGAYLATAAFNRTGSFLAAVAFALAATLAIGMLVEVIALRTLYERDHLDQVLATFGLILFFNEAVAIVWGRAALFTAVPRALSGHLQVLPGIPYPAYRAVIILVGLAVALLLYVVVSRTRLGMLSTVLGPSAADNAGPALASMLIYILMAAVLFFRPQGLFPAVRS